MLVPKCNLGRSLIHDSVFLRQNREQAPGILLSGEFSSLVILCGLYYLAIVVSFCYAML